MKLFNSLIVGSAVTSFITGYITNDVFNSIALYTPLAAISWAISECFNERKIKKQLLKESK
ncbi:hypothetical protein MHB47_10090 [Staphylococcus sp. FSL K6-3157]|uniref:hypothetical protein n=1 Tax=Staphylococcus sp. FSL K6-3157 TaxID=2921490 RepID=UPI0030F580C2